MNSTYAQRMRVVFATDPVVKFVGHLDMARTWERAIRRAGLPLAYSQGYNPQPRLQFAAALPVGFTSQAEVADVFLDANMDPGEFLSLLRAALPSGIRPLRASPVARELPSLQSQLLQARYRVELAGGAAGEIQSRLDGFMSAPAVWRERRRGKEMSRYDLRPLVLSLTITGDGNASDGVSCDVVMRSDPGATGRPDELLAELRLGDLQYRVIRTELIFGEGSRPAGHAEAVDLPQDGPPDS